MAKNTAKNVPASEVRAWALAQVEANGPFTDAEGNEVPVGTRGRIHPIHREAFVKAHRGRKVYVVASEAEKPTLTVKVKMLDSIGRATTRQVSVTRERAREILGHPEGKVGRFSKADLETVALALEAEALAEV